MQSACVIGDCGFIFIKLVIDMVPNPGVYISLIFKLDVAEDDPGNLVNQAITVLKERIDPDGLRNLEFHPIGGNRIEIRMPAGRKESRDARRAFNEILEAIDRRNIQRSEMRRWT